MERGPAPHWAGRLGLRLESLCPAARARTAAAPAAPPARAAGPWRAAGGVPAPALTRRPQDKEAEKQGQPLRVVYYKWLELVAVHSDAWLMAVAFFYAAKADATDRCDSRALLLEQPGRGLLVLRARPAAAHPSPPGSSCSP